MKDTDHPVRHPCVHRPERASARRRRGCARKNGQYGRGMAPSWAGATPLRCHGTRGGRSSPTSRTRDSFVACLAGVGSEIPAGACEEGKNFSLELRLQRFLHVVVWGG